MSSKKPLLICVVGATAIGKTSLAIKLARAFNTEIISADSRQFFKEMSIGTAVPSKEELDAVPHHFIQNKSIFEDYSVGDFERDSLALLKILFEKNTVVVMVGGSGLYVDAVIKGLDNFPEVPSKIRDQLNFELAEKGIETLQRELKNIDPEYFKKVDIQNPHRLVRALEIHRATGRPYSSFLRKENPERDFNTIFIGLTAERELIYNRINLRVDIMMADGLLDEAKSLLSFRDKNALQTVGYRELFEYFDGKISLEEAISEIKKNTRRFAKRQNTWFKKNEAINWFDYDTQPNEIIDYIKEKNAL
ncbi:MAG TPA: tRNA (adenosine(37)-N6)-dimethylallyltransferase MiaA [Aequorivita sp.]|uniref:tRNA dimethylallyltransferase n=1 Tax=Aequorivita aquimaris TaxID=1548749 RepID=A0A137RI91_9FLAO|nr:tRNA (adenosine(37)-N6)-dimethylallyltransferase MiaA [Aequorivita aquimaris]KXN99896.1 tRNA delta(2)-isopentenylpyrophosphate transferase [Aequorivita aquimaris]HAV54478.1 tRNA (adenosine(37)-N6)-dimethylallyltransferase MiaA [Aequorivita sp.]HBL79246.1 tRNA (adenosine(37)-N6)-dimethylallyltransferase MiaA [Aequorivita sp.]|tara:strand:- start:153 stop:1070 length:918 start_codon:yes stop_codon:yes gene_type:complete